MSRSLAVLVLAAGKGTRIKLSAPKVLLPLCGRTLLDSVLHAVQRLSPDRTLVVVGHDKEKVSESLSGAPGGKTLEFVDQGRAQGTGHAVRIAMDQLRDFQGDVVVVYGDCPLITTPTLKALLQTRGEAPGPVAGTTRSEVT